MGEAMVPVAAASEVMEVCPACLMIGILASKKGQLAALQELQGWLTLQMGNGWMEGQDQTRRLHKALICVKRMSNACLRQLT